MESYWTLNGQNNLEKEEQRSLTLSEIKTYYKATVIKMCGTNIKTDIQRDIYTQQRALKENPHLYGQIIFNKGARQFSGGRISPNGVWKLDTHVQENEFLDPYLIPYIE